jgi:energy-coupling factor transporter ATP-binding protein EcfA2
MVEIVKKLTPIVVGENLGVSNEAGIDAPDILVETDEAAVQGRTIILYGDSGVGKSTLAHSFARYYFIRTGLPVLLVAAEDSSKTIMQDLIDAGIIEAVFLTSSKIAPSVYERIVEGELPLPGQFDVVKTVKKVEGKDVTVESRKQKWLGKDEVAGRFGAVIFEGLSTIAENVLDYLRETGRFPREQSDGFVEGGRTHMAASQTAYGFTQAEGIKLLKNSGMLPVQRVLWTAHEAKGKDDFDGSLIRGPKLVGSAATNVIRKHAGILLHADQVEGEIRTYFTNHPDQTSPKIDWKAKVTVNPFFAREMAKQHPKGYFVPKLPTGDDYLSSNDGLIPFLKLEEEIRAKGSAGAKNLAAAVKSKLTQTKGE